MNVMLDLETMGNGSNAAIVAIGAVAFSEDGPASEFYRVVHLQSAVSKGGIIDASTVLWWLRQSEEARNAITSTLGISIDVALTEFADWLHSLEGAPVLWGNGATFDNVILANAYRSCGMDVPWKFWNDRCFRTLKAQYPDLQLPERGGVHHNALDDAKYQAQCAIVMLNQGA